MKRTEYFISENHQAVQLETAIGAVKAKRDEWLSKNEIRVGKIDSEDIKIVPHSVNNAYVFAVIQLSYYPK